jgi:Glycosyltransferase family 87
MRAATHPEPAELSREVIKSFAILGGFFFVVAVGTYLYGLDLSTPFPRDGSTLVVGRDFMNFWMYGRAVSLPDPGRWYDAAVYQRELATFLGAGYPGLNWSYPPTVMLIAAPFGQLGYLPALAVWTVLNLAVFFAVAYRQIADRRALLALMLSPAAAFCLMSGQSSFLTTAALVGIFAFLDRKPLIAGLLIGLMTLKPQLGLLLPVVLIASGRWRVFIVAAVTTLALAGLATALFGTQAWIDFVEKGLPAQNIVLADPEGIATPFYPTVFMNLRGIGFGYTPAMAVQVCFALAAAAAAGWAFRCRADADPRLLFALFVACSITAVPYLLVYDTLPLCFAALALLAGGLFDNRGAWLARLIYWLPLLQIGLGNLHIPGPALIAPLCAAYIVQRLRNAPAAALHPALNPG